LLDRVEEAITRRRRRWRADAALLTVLRTFAEHKTMARLFMIEALGAGPVFQPAAGVHDEFIGVMKKHLDEAVASGACGRWTRSWRAGRVRGAERGDPALVDQGEPARLEDAYDGCGRC
jgi:hypothetical protein